MEDKENNNMNTEQMSMRTSRLRKSQYRILIDNIDEIKESDDLGHRSIQKVKDIVNEANKLHDQCRPDARVLHTDETILDTILLTNACDFVVKCTRAIDLHGTSYEPLEFCEKLQSKIDGVDFLNFLIKDARNIIADTIKLSFLYGAYDLEKPAKSPQVRKQRQQPQKAQKRVPTQVVNSKEDSEDVDFVKYLFEVLKEEYMKNGGQSLPYYEFVIDTDDFGATVNNIFYCSFMIRDGIASITIENGEPRIFPVDRKEMKSFRSSGGSNTQIVTSIDMDFWKTFKTEGYIQKHMKQRRKSQS